jgi:hypothetical protein
MLRLQRQCQCGGDPDCTCDSDTGPDRKKEKESPRNALHRKPAGAPAVLDFATESFFHARAANRTSSASAPNIPIGAVNDPLEHEADQMADRVLRMPSVAPGPIQYSQHAASGSALRRACARAASPKLAPPKVHDVLRSSGQPLDKTTRAFFEPRFGADLSSIRIHADARAAESAQSVHAHAYAVGQDIAFGPGMYAPSTGAGRSLLAHELAHTLQHSAQPLGLHRSCKTGAACAAPIRGDSGRFGEKTEQEAEAERKKSGPPPAPGAPTPCSNTRHKDPATKFTALAAGEGATLPPEVSGIFIDACMAPSAAAQIDTCANFTDGTPPGADAAKNCIAVKTSDEDDAAAILLKPKASRNDKDNFTAREAASTVIHESQHSHFDANATALIAPAADCNLNTVVFHGPTPAPGGRDYNVEFYLSEISAEIAEFTPFFQNFKATGKGDVMFEEERFVTSAAGENIQGDIQALQCKCECGTVDDFVAKVFADATSAWPADQKLEFQRAMTRIMSPVWPKALQKT